MAHTMEMQMEAGEHNGDPKLVHIVEVCTQFAPWRFKGGSHHGHVPPMDTMTWTCEADYKNCDPSWFTPRSCEAGSYNGDAQPVYTTMVIPGRFKQW